MILCAIQAHLCIILASSTCACLYSRLLTERPAVQTNIENIKHHTAHAKQHSKDKMHERVPKRGAMLHIRHGWFIGSARAHTQIRTCIGYAIGEKNGKKCYRTFLCLFDKWEKKRTWKIILIRG